MESTALPLARGALDVEPLSPHDGGNWAHVSSALAMSQARDPQQEQALLMRRVSSYQGSYFPHRQSESLLPRQNSRGPTSYGGLAIKRTPRHSYGAGGKLPSQASGSFFPVTSRAVEMEPTESRADRAKRVTLTVMVNLTSGIIAFLLSSTLAVSCASVVVGHGTPLATVIADFIDMNLLGTAVLCVVLAWFSQAPWTLGAMDVFVAPIMSSMADKITSHLDGDLEKVLPTTIVMVSLTSAILGAVFFIMGSFRVTSIANYMPYPVIAGFLSGIGAELMRNGIHMASSKAFTLEFFTIKQQLLIWPAVLFAGLARFGQHLKIPVAISFPCLLIVALLGYQLFMSFAGMDVHDQGAAGWVFSWKAKVVRDTPRWYSWSHIKLKHVDWHALTHECMGFMVSLVILGALKYSVATTSLSTLFGREISPDNEMRVIGLANMASGVLGCCGGCHYLSAMGIMKQFEAHEKVPALVCAVLIAMLWSQGIGMLQYVPKFIFGGLLLSVGLHFIEAYFVAPFSFLKPVEKGIVVLITTSFLVIGMLESVGLGVVISMVELIYRIYEVGCVHHETTGALARSAVDRTPEQTRFLDEEGSAIFVLRLQGYLFFGTSVNILERIETRVRSIEFPKLKFVVIDFGLVPSFDATALLNFRKASVLADRYMFDIYFCGLKPSIELALRQNHYSQRVHLLSSDVDVTLEICENELLPDELKTQATGSIEEWRHLSQLDLWEHFMLMHDTSNEGSGIDTPKLLPLAAHLDIVNLSTGSVLLTTPGTNRDTYFVCFGYINVMSDSEFSNTRNIPGIVAPDSATPSTSPSSSDFMMENEEEESLGASITRRLSFAVPETQSWTPFTTAKSRLLKIGAGSVITPNMSAAGDSAQTYRYIATSDCIVLRLSAAAMQQLEASAPHTAVEVLKMLNKRLASRFRHSNKRVSQLSSLLYK